MGCYRYQDSINTVPEDGIVAMLWEESKLRAKRTIKDLRDRRLIKFSKQDMGYFLHPVMREEAVSRLKDGCGEWTKEGEEANQKAAVFLKHDIKNVVTQFEAIEHLFCINDTQGVVSILLYNILGAEKLDNIRCSANLWNNVLPIIRIGEKAIKHENILTTDDFALVLTVLGILYSEIGANIKAIKTAEELLKRCEILVNNQSSEKLKFAHLSAYMIQGRAFRLLGNYDKSEIFCQKASKYGQDSKNSIWKGLALYELALAKLEKNEPRKALNCIVVAAFMASGILGLPNGLKKLLFEPIESVGKQLSELITKHEKSDDRTKKFRILYNTAKALNRMAESNDIPPFPIKFKLQNKFFYDLAKTVLDLAGKYVHKEDKGSPVYLYLEYAEYYRNIEDSNKAEGYYQKTLGLFSTMPTICQAMYKRSYCQFKYELGEDEVALAECKQTEILLSETEFYSWTLDNYLMIMELLAKRKDDMNVTEVELADYYRKAQDLCEKIGEPKQYNLNRVNRAFEQRVKQ
jgi:tetratricopeptide (TPR) repeat protein